MTFSCSTFIKARRELGIEPAVGEKTKEWQIISLPHTQQEDEHNCGVYVLMVNIVRLYTLCTCIQLPLVKS